MRAAAGEDLHLDRAEEGVHGHGFGRPKEGSKGACNSCSIIRLSVHSPSSSSSVSSGCRSSSCPERQDGARRGDRDLSLLAARPALRELAHRLGGGSEKARLRRRAMCRADRECWLTWKASMASLN